MLWSLNSFSGSEPHGGSGVMKMALIGSGCGAWLIYWKKEGPGEGARAGEGEGGDD